MSGERERRREQEAAGDAIDFAVDALANRLGGGAIEVRRIAGGQSNPTYFITHGGRRLVLRKAPGGAVLPSAHAVDREFRVMSALAGSGVPVPAMILLEEDPAVIGAPFYLMERVEGRVIHDSALPGFAPEARARVYEDAAKTLARLHRVDWRAIGLEGFGREGGYFARQIARWTKQWALSKTREDENIEALARWLPENIPSDDATAIVHGDYRIGNLILAPDAPEIVAVLDWELSTLGHPLADLAHFSVFWDLAPDQLGGVAGLDRAALGLPDRESFADAYRRAGGIEEPLRPFHRVLALFRFAVIFEGITARRKSGIAAGGDAERVGALSSVCAEIAAEALARDGP